MKEPIWQRRGSLQTIMHLTELVAICLLLFGALILSTFPASADEWVIESVFSSVHNGQYTSIDVDNNGYPHISCGGLADGRELNYAHKDASGWHVETVDGSGQYTSIALDGSGYPHISYCVWWDRGPEALEYAYEDAYGWHREVVDHREEGQGHTGEYTSIALDSTGYPHISYFQEFDYSLRYAYFDGTTWQLTTVRSRCYASQSTDIALDANDQPYISYSNSSTGHDNLLCVYLEDSDWQLDTVDDVEYYSNYMSISLDGDGNPRIAYYAHNLFEPDGYLKFSSKDVSGWHTETVDVGPGVGKYVSLAVDASGHAHISYYDQTNGDLKYAYQSSSSWNIETVDSDGLVGEYSSIALDASGYPHISYYDRTNGNLKYAHLSAVPPTHTVSTPGTPIGPSSGQVGVSLDFSTGGSTCSQGHAVEYQFSWGDGAYSTWSSSTSASHSYSSAGTYQVKAHARCSQDTFITSGWSSTKAVAISAATPSHMVSTPSTPTGPSSGQVGDSLSFSTGSSTCTQGHAVEYQFSWGDGEYSTWSSSTSASHSYSSAGTYQVKAHARCTQDTFVTSGWSSTKTVTISAAPPSHTVSTPSTPIGPSSGQVGDSLSFSTGSSTCTQGHAVEYQFSWGDGEYSTWSSSTSASHSYSSAGTYQVKAHARCTQDTFVTSGWSSTKAVTISAVPPSHTVSTPSTPTGPSSGQVEDSLDFSTGGSTCSQGHTVQYQFDWGDGSGYSVWISSTSASHSYSSAGTYQVKAHARCTTDTAVISNWSSTKTVSISEEPPAHTVSTPDAPSGPSSSHMGESVVFSSNEGTCSQGHWLQYQFDWDDDTTTNWTSASSDSHVYDSAGVYEVRVQARCSTDTSVTSSWSPAATIVVSLGSVPPTVPSWRENLQKGDILLCRTPHSPFFYIPLGTVIMDWTHVGIYDGNGWIIEAYKPNVKRSTIESWDYPEKVAVKIVRVIGVTQFWADSVISFAESQIEHPYDLKFFQKSMTGDSWYCSELAWAAYKRIGIDLDPDPFVVFPDEIAESSLVEVIGEHIEYWEPPPDSNDLLAYLGKCPIDLLITDPDGLRMGPSVEEVTDSLYVEEDFDEDGETHILVLFLDPKPGRYSIEVIPRDEAQPTDRYSLIVKNRGTDSEILLANQVPIANIPMDPYEVEVPEASTDVNPPTQRVQVGSNPISSAGCIFWLDLPENVTQAKLMIFSITGGLVFETQIETGALRFPSAGSWNPVDQDGVPLANGPYIYVLIGDGKVIGQGKMVIQR